VRFKELVPKVHPDLGGSPHLADLVIRAKATLLPHAAPAAPVAAAAAAPATTPAPTTDAPPTAPEPEHAPNTVPDE
jgi:hypothetical protein